MKYFPCRDSDQKRAYSFEDAVFAGWAEDNGMILPETIPKVDAGMLRMWSSLEYSALCVEILSLFISVEDIPKEDLCAVVNRSFENFGGDGSVVQLQQLDGTTEKEVFVCELWHGPTLAFKDLGMQVLAQLLSYFLNRRNAVKDSPPQYLNLLVGTSGDTGSSAIEAVMGLPYISITVLYPVGHGISKVQELQMTTVTHPSVHVIGVDGTSDDLDIPMEAVFSMTEFKKKHNLGTVNSVNICRLLVQTIHFFYSYLQIYPSAEETINFVVPTGAAGHISAGVIALQMGLPIKSLIAATNANCILHRILQTGDSGQQRAVKATVSPSMDIQVPYNFERLLYLAGVDGRRIDTMMTAFKKSGTLMLPDDIRDSLRHRCALSSATADDAGTLRTIRSVYVASDKKYVIDPHTAVGVHAAYANVMPRETAGAERVVCMSCAHPSKFGSTISRALANETTEVDDPWWWVSLADRKHRNVSRVMSLQEASCHTVRLSRDEDWTAYLKVHLQNVQATWEGKC